MKIAQALAERSSLQERLNQLGDRIAQSARHPEGQEPAEDVEALLGESDRLHDRLEALIEALNRTNSTTVVEGRTLTAHLARREVLARRRKFLTAAAEAAVGGGRYDHFMHTDVRQVRALDVASVRARADQLAREHRELDTLVQEANWTHELV